MHRRANMRLIEQQSKLKTKHKGKLTKDKVQNINDAMKNFFFDHNGKAIK